MAAVETGSSAADAGAATAADSAPGNAGGAAGSSNAGAGAAAAANSAPGGAGGADEGSSDAGAGVAVTADSALGNGAKGKKKKRSPAARRHAASGHERDVRRRLGDGRAEPAGRTSEGVADSAGPP